MEHEEKGTPVAQEAVERARHVRRRVAQLECGGRGA
jgi:hypothetical protein